MQRRLYKENISLAFDVLVEIISVNGTDNHQVLPAYILLKIG